jgi:hypothetical protein
MICHATAAVKRHILRTMYRGKFLYIVPLFAKEPIFRSFVTGYTPITFSRSEKQHAIYFIKSNALDLKTAHCPRGPCACVSGPCGGNRTEHRAQSKCLHKLSVIQLLEIVIVSST